MNGGGNSQLDPNGWWLCGAVVGRSHKYLVPLCLVFGVTADCISACSSSVMHVKLNKARQADCFQELSLLKTELN